MASSNTLLIVDDEQGILDAFVRCLRWAGGPSGPRATPAPDSAEAVLELPGGRRVLIARSGEEAVALVEKERAEGRHVAGGFFDLKLGDGMDGLETIRRLRELAPGLLCTVVTGYDDCSVDDINQLFLPDHADEWDYMSKPFTRWEVAQKARQMIESWNRRRREHGQLAEISRLNETLEQYGEELEQRVAQRTSDLAKANDQLERRSGELEQSLQALATTQERLLQVEKMGSIGQLSSGVARAVGGPLGFVSANLATLEGHLERLSAFVTRISEEAAAAVDGALPAADPADEAERRRVSLQKARRELRVDYVLDDAPQLVAEARQGMSRIRNVVDSLGAFSRPVHAEASGVDLNVGLRTSLALVEGELAEGAVLDLDLGELPPIIGRSNDLNQLWMILLSNAVEAISERGAEGRILVSSGVGDDGVVIEVRDNGPGVSPEVAARVFEPFYTTKATGEGSGLGLSVAYGIARRHGGEITVESRPGEGARFLVRLPAAAAVSSTPA